MSWRDRVSAVLGTSPARGAAARTDENMAGGEPPKPTKAPFVSFVGTHPPMFAPISRAENDSELLPDRAAESRRQRVLAERPGTRYAVVTDADADPDAVILAIAIRGAMPDGSTVTGEMLIPRAKYDPFLLLELIERHGGTLHRRSTAMSLLSKLERLERVVSSKHEGDSLEPSPDLIADAVRLLDEIKARPKPTIHERIAWLRERIKENETLEEPWKFLDAWCHAELVRLETDLAKLQ